MRKTGYKNVKNIFEEITDKKKRANGSLFHLISKLIS